MISCGEIKINIQLKPYYFTLGECEYHDKEVLHLIGMREF